ncbi:MULTISPECIES: cell wall hydrolase [Pseudomonas]|jgi:spore germination cell wall hydrolase CwlJ-like protein|uniref:Cell wall hydrolase n=2 Tax=Pseudomonas fluorescens group TaxID=136843 RepID=A0AB36CVY8_9PSED|nr:MULTISPECIES: cell wall hydrolase [Pseudomonas]MBU0526732.1 cell wall hydrolase [Gammaproteobacteria bacterium]MBU0822751.1 cell wall hydrolase [Gammaproteobacteria bacterium]MBU0843123.1 cell wall hydrolase [Gammaproteobacteria bacterium]MBU1844342.1 cell wall hydrolase [Gammaproteobacteria bacterium]NMZ80029.1 cell wall hydrolase [Pseudomonas mandelii]
MSFKWSVAFLVVTLVAGQVIADDQQQKKEVAEDKAQVLEQKAADKSADVPVPKSEAITQSEVQAVDPAGKSPLDDAITCMARSIYWEAKGKDTDDMAAVANVVMNRLGHAGFPDTVCAVVKQGSETKSCQFSWWCDGRPDTVQEETQYALAKEIARKALNKQLPDRTGGAMYFHDRTVKPDWAKEYIKTAEIGMFRFYKPHDGSAK